MKRKIGVAEGDAKVHIPTVHGLQTKVQTLWQELSAVMKEDSITRERIRLLEREFTSQMDEVNRLKFELQQAKLVLPYEQIGGDTFKAGEELGIGSSSSEGIYEDKQATLDCAASSVEVTLRKVHHSKQKLDCAVKVVERNRLKLKKTFRTLLCTCR